MEAKCPTKIQLELFKAIPNLKTDKEVQELRDALSDLFAKKAQEEMDRLYESGKWSLEKLELLKE